MLAARPLGAPATPTPSWAAALALPVAWGVLRGVRGAPSERALLPWIDRRDGLGGLLVASREADVGDWNDELERRLAAAPARLPSADLRRPILRGILGVMLVVAVAALPAPPPPKPPVRASALAAAVAELERSFETLREERPLDPRAAEEMRERLDDLKARLDAGTPPSWSDVDALERALERERARLDDALADAAHALAGLAAGEAGGANAAEIRKALEAAAASGALAGLPKELMDKLGGVDAIKAGKAVLADGDDASLRATAREIAEALADDLDASLDGLGDGEAARGLARSGAAEFEEAEDGHRHTAECAGGT